MADIKDRYVKKAKNLVRDKFPEMSDVEPSLTRKRSQSKGRSGRSRSTGGENCSSRYVLTFKKEVSLPGGSKLKRTVRVTLDESGEVVKLTSSK